MNNLLTDVSKQCSDRASTGDLSVARTLGDYARHSWMLWPRPCYLIFLDASSSKRNVTVWGPSLCLSVCLSRRHTVTHHETAWNAASVHFGPTIRKPTYVFGLNLSSFMSVLLILGRKYTLAASCVAPWWVMLIATCPIKVRKKTGQAGRTNRPMPDRNNAFR